MEFWQIIWLIFVIATIAWLILLAARGGFLIAKCLEIQRKIDVLSKSIERRNRVR